MRTRAIFSVVLLGFGATACTQILGIDERTLRDDTKTTSNGSTTGNDDGGAPRTDSGTDAGESTSEAGFPFDAAEAPRAYVQSAPVDFGQVYCGAPAPADKSVHVANVGGDGDLDWEASLDQTSVFSIDGPPAGNLDAADSFVDVKIASAGAPAFATAGVVTATLTITIKQAGVLVSKTDIPVTQTAAGATLSLDPSSIAFGQVQTGSSATPIAVSLRNTGNMPISIGFGAASDPQFSLVNGNGTTLAPGQSTTDLAATFSPTVAGAASTKIALLPGNTPICGAVPSGIDLSGTGTNGPIAVQPGSLDFGLVDCQKQGTAQQINVTTTGSQLSWTASLGKGSSSPYVLSQSAGTASSGKPGVVTVTPRVMPATADTTADAFADTLTIVAPDGSHVIPLHETAHGAVLSQSTSSIAFGGVNTGTKATSQLNVVNTGNASATVSYLPSAGTFSVSTQGASVAGQGTSVVSTVTFAPTSTGSFSDTATMKVSSDTVLCADLPKGIALSGTGTQTYASVSPTTLDFGMVNCGATGSKQTVTIKNSASLWSNTFTWTATLGKGSSSPYKLSSTTNQLSGQGTASIDVTPVAIPSVSSTDADYYADTLTITTNALNDTPHIISLHETAQGAILSFNPTSVAFGSVAGGSTATDTFQIVNTGNYPASKVSLALGSNAVFSVSTTSNITVNGGSSTSDTATFKPAKGSTGAKSTTVTPSFSGANCGGTPTPLTLSGTGT